MEERAMNRPYGKGFLEKLKPYKYPVLVLLIGIGLLLFPDLHKEQQPLDVDQNETTLDLEQRLEMLLSEIDGAGSVKVLLSLDTGETVTYQEDRQLREQEAQKEQDTRTVLISQNGDEVPVIVKTKYPIYKGAVVVCQGADRAAVKLSIVQAVSSLTGLGSDKITVVKMKG